jgi:hypothetical protein
MRALLATPALGLLALGATGCITLTGEFGTEISVENLARIREGETTREEILEWFGPPSGFFNPTVLDLITEDVAALETPLPQVNDVFSYRFIVNDTSMVLIPIFLGRVELGATFETLTVFFDPEGRVKYHAYRRDERTSGGGTP